MSYDQFKDYLNQELNKIRELGLYKSERVISSAQGPEITLASGETVLNFCANNYLGLSGSTIIARAATKAIHERGYGMSSVRFICGTQDLHKALETRISKFFGTEDTILFAACFDANGGVFEPLLTEQDAIISDELNHASIIDGIRLCKAKRYLYANADMVMLEQKLQEAQLDRFRLIVTDGVFSMDGNVAPLDKILELAKKYNALVMVDESHSAGVVGTTGHGITEFYDAQGEVDIITGTLGKAFGGAIGGFTTGRKEIIELLRQRSRPYLFSNSLPPAVLGASIAALDMIEDEPALHTSLELNTANFYIGMKEGGFDIKPTNSAIIAVMLYDAKVAKEMAERLLKEGIYVTSFSYPVVPNNKARIRVQLSAAHTPEHIDKAVKAFIKVAHAMGIRRN